MRGHRLPGASRGNVAFHIVRTLGDRECNFSGQDFWARRYFVSTVGRDEQVIRELFRRQQDENATWKMIYRVRAHPENQEEKRFRPRPIASIRTSVCLFSIPRAPASGARGRAQPPGSALGQQKNTVCKPADSCTRMKGPASDICRGIGL